MLFKFWDALTEHFKGKQYWSRIQPLFTLIFLYLLGLMLAYQYIGWKYRIVPALPLYFRSYVFKQITVVFVGIGLIAYVLGRRSAGTGEPGRFGRVVRAYAPLVVRKALLTALVLAFLVPAFLYLSPRQVSHIRVKFLAEPDFNQYALVYLIYELNREQRNWYFEVDFNIFNAAVLTTKERSACDGEYRSLCYAESLASGRPFIGITTEQLGADFFSQNRGPVSVISTYQWERYAPPSTYEFLVHSLVVQGILIHLNKFGPGLPGAFQESRVAYGDLFQFSPDRREMKAAILAPHLSLKGQELLLNSFGIEYLTTCLNLLDLEWMRSKRITHNLEKSFGVRL